ncbi:MAG: nucleotidyltransferase family protein [Gammaproteobacteria bacterium]|nr:nucleotidyltransferase family protein [Gammaproteobacteria bacterium]
MILAAGRGERMRPLTDHTPKPLLQVAGRALIDHLIERLAAAGLCKLVVNNAWLGEQLVKHLGSGERLGVSIEHSGEPPGALETAGGIRQALHLLSDPFVVINSDIWSDFPLARLHEAAATLVQGDCLAHLVLVPNPSHNPDGDFALLGSRVLNAGGVRRTYAGLGVYRRAGFATLVPGRQPLGPLLRAWAAQQRLSGECHVGAWMDVGTPDRLQALRHQLEAEAAATDPARHGASARPSTCRREPAGSCPGDDVHQA